MPTFVYDQPFTDVPSGQALGFHVDSSCAPDVQTAAVTFVDVASGQALGFHVDTAGVPVVGTAATTFVSVPSGALGFHADTTSVAGGITPADSVPEQFIFPPVKPFPSPKTFTPKPGYTDLGGTVIYSPYGHTYDILWGLATGNGVIHTTHPDIAAGLRLLDFALTES